MRDFAEDIGRYLAFQPVGARQGSYRYVALKFVRRHRAGAAIAAAACLFLAASAALIVRQSQVARFERDRAQRRFNEVRRLAHSVIFDLGQIASLPGSTPVRKELIANVIVYVDGLAKESAGDSGLQQELAEAYLRIGDLQGGGNENLGDQQGALASFQRAERIARALVAAQPSFGARQLLLQALRDLGGVYDRTSDRRKATAYRKETLALARELQKQFPANEGARLMLANSLFDMAGLTSDSQSLAFRLEALPIFEELLQAKPADPKRQRNAALINKSIAGYWLDVDVARALPFLQRARALDEARLANDPGHQGAKLDLSFDYGELGQYFERQRNFLSALEYQRKTLAIRRDLASSDPKDVWKQDRLAWTLTNTASILLSLHDYPGAFKNLAEARSISERLGISTKTRTANYAVALLFSGEADRAVGRERAACQEFSKARDLFAKAPNTSLIARPLAELQEDMASCGRR